MCVSVCEWVKERFFHPRVSRSRFYLCWSWKRKTAAVFDLLKVFFFSFQIMFESKDTKVVLSQLFYLFKKKRKKEPFYLNYCDHAFL